MKWILNRIRRLTAVVPNADKRIYRCPERVARALQQEMYSLDHGRRIGEVGLQDGTRYLHRISMLS